MKLRDMMSRAVRSALANPDLDREAERFNRSVKSKTTFALVFVFLYHWHKSENKIKNKQILLPLKNHTASMLFGPRAQFLSFQSKTQPSFQKNFRMKNCSRKKIFSYTTSFLDDANFLQYFSLRRTIFCLEKILTRCGNTDSI